MSDPKTTDTMIAALLREREGYVSRGLEDRVAAVDEQLELRGHKVEEKAPGGRRARVQQKAEPAAKHTAD